MDAVEETLPPTLAHLNPIFKRNKMPWLESIGWYMSRPKSWHQLGSWINWLPCIKAVATLKFVCLPWMKVIVSGESSIFFMFQVYISNLTHPHTSYFIVPRQTWLSVNGDMIFVQPFWTLDQVSVSIIRHWHPFQSWHWPPRPCQGYSRTL